MAISGAPAVRRRPVGIRAFAPVHLAARRRREMLLLAAVAAVYLVDQLLFNDLGRGSLSWDESIYFSQVDPRSPATFFSAPRSRGSGLLAAPVALFTSSPPAIRGYLAVLSAVLLFAAFATWRPVIGGGTAALAALLFSTLWVSVDYGSQAMPNLWSALCAVAAAGLFLRAVRPAGPEPDLRLLAGLAFALAWVGLIRAPDGFWAGAPLLSAALLVPSWRRRRIVAAIVVGVAAGLAEWVIEAYVRFGGVLQRLADSASIEGGMSPTWNVGNAYRAANGPLLCRPCLVGDPPVQQNAWWVVLPVLALLGAVAAGRTGRRAAALLPAAIAFSVSLPYLFMIGYFAARFLLPWYALLAIPAAIGPAAGLRALRERVTGLRIAAAVLACAVFAAHLAVQAGIQLGHARAAVPADGRYRALADALRRIGVTPPCLVAGNTEPIAYDAGCSSSLTEDPRTDSSMAYGPAVVRAARHEAVAVLVPPGGGPPGYAPGWTRHELTGSPWVFGWAAYLPPGPGPGTARPGSAQR